MKERTEKKGVKTLPSKNSMDGEEVANPLTPQETVAAAEDIPSPTPSGTSFTMNSEGRREGEVKEKEVEEQEVEESEDEEMQMREGRGKYSNPRTKKPKKERKKKKSHHLLSTPGTFFQKNRRRREVRVESTHWKDGEGNCSSPKSRTRSRRGNSESYGNGYR